MATEFVLVFSSMSAAMQGEIALGDAGVSVRAMGLPPQIASGCGLALRVYEADLTRAQAVLAEMNIGVTVYEKNGRNYSVAE